MKVLSELRDQIRSWSEREDMSDAQIDNFVYLVEQDYKEEFFSPANEVEVILTVDAEGRIEIPFDYIRGKHMYLLDGAGGRTKINRKPHDVVTYGGEEFEAGSPIYFERRTGYFIFSPKPAEGSQISLIYYRIIPSLTQLESNQTNAILEVAPTVYLFGCLQLLHEYTFNEERASYYEKKYTQAKNDYVKLQDREEMSGSSLSVFPALYEGE